MRIYIDLNCFNRPFDDQRQDRVRRETVAVFNILNRVLEENDSLIWSWVLSFENSRHPKPDRRDEITLWQGRAEVVVALTTKIRRRSRQLETKGIPALDAAHLASAEAGGAEVFLTCDDVVIKRARRLGLGLRVMNPVAYWKKVSSHG
jgi:hypothetical protein